MAIVEALSLHWSEGTGWSTGRQSMDVRVNGQKAESVSTGADRLLEVQGEGSGGGLCWFPSPYWILYILSHQAIALF